MKVAEESSLEPLRKHPWNSQKQYEANVYVFLCIITPWKYIAIVCYIKEVTDEKAFSTQKLI